MQCHAVKVTGVDMFSHSHTASVPCVHMCIVCDTSSCSDAEHENRTVTDSTPSVLAQVRVVKAATTHLVVEADTENVLKRKRIQKTDPTGHAV